jgi:plastocyanin
MKALASRKRLGMAAALPLAVAATLVTSSALAQDKYTVTIKDHKFDPAAIEAPAGERFQMTIVNEDPTPEEFESHDFHVEKIVSGNSTIKVFVGPLEPGEYKFFGEMHSDTAQGTLTVK